MRGYTCAPSFLISRTSIVPDFDLQERFAAFDADRAVTGGGGEEAAKIALDAGLQVKDLSTAS